HTVSSESYEIWHCNQCQLRFTQDVPDEQHIGPYYEAEEYISHSNTNKGLINRLYQIVRNYTLQRKQKLVSRLVQTEQASILDIGCGTGDFLGTMKSAGWTTQGLEPDPTARTMAIERHGLTVGMPEELFGFSEASFDVVSMWHVLEHVHRLHEYLEQIEKILQPTGRFLVAVPNYPAKDASTYQAKWAAYDVPRHLYHFRPSAMEPLLAQHGLEIAEIRQMPFDAFYVSLLSEKYVHGRLRLISGFWNGLRSFLNARANPKEGSSLLYVIRKIKGA
ncbi:MAG: class I SAM-dependent methyltransferase, partial [Bacteroidota bacterium]